MSVDLEDGYGPAPGRRRARDRARRPRRAPSAARSRTTTRAPGLYEAGDAAERVAAAARPRARCDFPFMLTARAENHIRGNPDLDDTIARLQAYERAGADVLYAPGLRTREEIARCTPPSAGRSTCSRCRGMCCRDSSRAGAQRISVGGGLTWAAVNGLVAAASGSSGTIPGRSRPELKGWLSG